MDKNEYTNVHTNNFFLVKLLLVIDHMFLINFVFHKIKTLYKFYSKKLRWN